MSQCAVQGTSEACFGKNLLKVGVSSSGGSGRCATRSRSTAPTAALVVSEPMSVVPVFSDER